jgi:hypothetical protein
MSDDKLIFSRSPIAAGTYNLFFRILDLAGNLEISNPITVSVAPATGQAVMTISQQQVTMPKLQADILQQGFWNGWKR